MTGLRVSEGIALNGKILILKRKWIHVHSTIEKDKTVYGMLNNKQRQ